MTYNKPDTKLDECIYVAEKVIPADLCDIVIKDIETREWQPHSWHNNVTNTTNSEKTMELDIQPASPELQRVLGDYTVEAARMYCKNYMFPFTNQPDRSGQMVTDFCPIRFNRYAPGQIMRQHHDHIHSIFDGKLRGIPVLSFILNLNDDYEGADLFFWEDTVVPLGKGDIIIFPSNWLFPHGVTEATKGKRYSAVTWGW